jgi:hypothetical protein
VKKRRTLRPNPAKSRTRKTTLRLLQLEAEVADAVVLLAAAVVVALDV